ncbi:hypothetical protein QBC44DRAFT_318951 [Cladorrhinum sp. PSN332]|nr:hypothetical protein QBC44DRAFT_318951 [Cladorrhinum sp. PSN332]
MRLFGYYEQAKRICCAICFENYVVMEFYVRIYHRCLHGSPLSYFLYFSIFFFCTIVIFAQGGRQSVKE